MKRKQEPWAVEALGALNFPSSSSGDARVSAVEASSSGAAGIFGINSAAA